jgi:hypothetical protein
VLLTPNDRASKHALHSTQQHYRSLTIERAKERALTLVPCVLETRVFPTFLTLNTDGAFISYQSFLLKGSTLQEDNKHRHQTRNRSGPDLRAREGSERTPDLRKRRGRGRRNSRLLLASFLPLGNALILADRHTCLPPATPLPVLAVLGRWRASSWRRSVRGRVFAFLEWSAYIRKGSGVLGLLGKNWARWASIWQPS